MERQQRLAKLGVIDLPSKQINNLLQKASRKNELVARPVYNKASSLPVVWDTKSVGMMLEVVRHLRLQPIYSTDAASKRGRSRCAN